MVLYPIKLIKFEVEGLTKVIGQGSQTLRFSLAAYFILNCGKGEFPTNTDIKNSDICQILRVGDQTIDRVKKKFIEEGFDSVLEQKVSTQNYTKKMDGDNEAKLVSLRCGGLTPRFAKWPLRLLADKIVELSYIDFISHVAEGKIQKKK